MATERHDDIISIAVLGDIGSGKSSLVGRIRQQQEQLPATSAIWTYSESPQLPSLNLTVDSWMYSYYSSKWNKTVTFIDTPGALSYIRNTSMAVSMADAVVLMVRAGETHLSKQLDPQRGMLCFHAVMALTANIRKFVIVVTHLDTQENPSQAFQTASDDVRSVLKRLGLADISIIGAVPYTPFDSTNLQDPWKVFPWWQGQQTLLDMLESLRVDRVSNQPLLASVYRPHHRNRDHVVVIGRVTQGVMYVGQELLFGSSETVVKVHSLQERGQPTDAVRPGHFFRVEVSLKCASRVCHGELISDLNRSPLNIVRKFTATVICVNPVNALRPGVGPIMFCGSQAIQVYMAEFSNLRVAKTGLAITDTQSLKRGYAAEVVMIPQRHMSVHPSCNFVLFDGLRIVAAGGVLTSLSLEHPQWAPVSGVHCLFTREFRNVVRTVLLCAQCKADGTPWHPQCLLATLPVEMVQHVIGIVAQAYRNRRTVRKLRFVLEPTHSS
eukprot:TRINITY_DN9436_c0_g1_i1.p1 TRINITY_DN9436_c0_g1~~TRINITY_DN9436_c0_g1_i1.p1  ORF type:complete len:496 (-),score=77.89 TRINITY_DN9436_c0_g1_i1:172-1659(-)